jgi:tetratricopeptide (TPR) repeat protein
MSFDKIKAMKNAERFLSQGKLRAAIGEYKRVIDDNPKDFSTLNIMGDLYVKNSETKEAVKCYQQVAEHYYGQGFANKAIAIYNKIARLEPNSMEIAERLGQLYQVRGSFAEAREQYTKVAESYQSKGRKLEALEIWKRIAELDPNNTEVYMTIGNACLQENQNSDAADAFAEAGLRFNSTGKYEEAVGAFTKGLSIQSNNIKILKGFVEAKIGLGCSDEAAETLEKVLLENPYAREILLLLTDCYLDMSAPKQAEETVIKLVQQEPSHFPKFLEIVKSYMEGDDIESTVRVLSISFEHVLGAGLSDEFNGWINEVLARNPEYIDGLRLLVKFHSWHRDPVEIRKSLERLAETARITESVEDERFAVGQLAAMSPLQPEYALRLEELKQKYGFDDSVIPVVESSVIPEFESFVALNSDEIQNIGRDTSAENLEQYAGEFSFSDEENSENVNENEDPERVTDFRMVDESPATDFSDENLEGPQIEEPNTFETSEEAETDAEVDPRSLAAEHRLDQELESVQFYVTQGYRDLALKCLDGLEVEFQENPKFIEMRQSLLGSDEVATEVDAILEEEPLKIPETQPVVDTSQQVDEVMSPAVNVFEQFRNDLGLEELEEDNEGDYSTLYHTAIAYKEMGLLEDAIKEFQDAINMVEINDGTRRYFQCANLLGHCFMLKGMPNLAQTWFKRAMDTVGLIDEEIQALHYELANAYEASGEKDKAFEHFGQVYALDVHYRDIGQRIQNLRENYSSSMIN